MFYEKTTKNKGPPPRPPLKKKVSRVELRIPDVEGERAIYCATTQHCCPWNSAARCCLKPAKPYLWRIERYIRGKQAWFWQLKPHFNSFCRIWRTYGRQVSRKTVVKSLSACDSWPLHEENQLRFSDSKHFRFYWTKKRFSAELYSLKNHEIGSLVVRKVKKSCDSRQNRELGPAWKTSQKASKDHKLLYQSWP